MSPFVYGFYYHMISTLGILALSIDNITSRMLYFSQLTKNKYLSDLFLTVLFGSLSLALGLLFDLNQGVADFRESPLLILIFYLKHPVFIALASLITSFANYGSFITTFAMHMVGLTAAWYFMQWLKGQGFSRQHRGISWAIFVVTYYGIFILPTWIIVRCWLLGLTIVPEDSLAAMGLSTESNFFEMYVALFSSAKYEVIMTATVTVLYLMEWEGRRFLESSNQSLEKLVAQRTEELELANELMMKLNKKLLNKNYEIQMINMELDELAKERSKRIQSQREALSNYAQINSHEVRAPLIRILSVARQLEDVDDMDTREELVTSIYESASELDQVVHKINTILTANKGAEAMT